MTNDEMSALFSEFPGADADRQTEIMGAILSENETINSQLEQARVDLETAQNDLNASRSNYDRLRQQYVDRFLEGPKPGPSPEPDPTPAPQRKTFDSLFKEA